MSPLRRRAASRLETGLPIVAAKAVNRNTPQYARSAQMMAALRAAFLYSEKRARECVFASAEKALASSERVPTLSALIRSTLHLARVHAASIGYELANSETVTRAVFNAMVRAGALLGLNGQPISSGVRSYADHVEGFAEDYRDLTESFLLEFLIEALGDVRPRDHLALAHVLFRQFDTNVPVTDLEDRVVTLLANISDRIDVCDSGTYVVRPERSWTRAVG